MPRKLAVVLGHSHTGALVHAVTTRQREPSTDDDLHVLMFEAWKFSGQPPYVTTGEDGSSRFNPALFTAAKPFFDDFGSAIYIAMFGGNDWAVLSMTQHARPFDFQLPEAPGLPLDTEAERVPLGYVRAVLQPLADKYLYQLFKLRQATGEPIYSVTPPPPIADNDFLADRLDGFFRGQTDFSSQLSGKYLRLKMWLLQKQLHQKICDENGIRIIDPPPIAVTDEGFLTPSYYGNDATHANTAYGNLILDQIETVAHARFAAWHWFS